MQTLDKLFKETFVISKDIKTTEVDYVYKFSNVFQDPESVLNFKNKLSLWESEEGSKPGVNSLMLPHWTTQYICDQFIPDSIDYIKGETVYFNNTRFNYFYYNNKNIHSEPKTLSSNNCLLPHCDPTFAFRNWILLVNLSEDPITTCFWSYMYQKRINHQKEFNEFEDYTSYNNINEDNIDEKLSHGLLRKQFPLTYGFNEAIIYDGNRLHQPIITKNFTRENPRLVLRVQIRGSDLTPDDVCDGDEGFE